MPQAHLKVQKKILVVFGTRPEAIKMAPVIRALQSKPDFDVLVCVSAQHREMLDQALEVFNIRPHIDLNVMQVNQDLVDVTCAVLSGVREVIGNYGPDAVLVHGDTTTAFATALACFYAGIPLGHVEAGLRTYDIASPFPEEFNRQVIGKVTRWHFAPTTYCQQNLQRERVPSHAIFVTGNTVIDALRWTLAQYGEDRMLAQRVNAFLDSQLPFDWRECRFVLMTGHRRESFGGGFERICQSVLRLANAYPEVHFVYPVHLNPAVRGPVGAMLDEVDNVHLLAPMGYVPFAVLMAHCHLVLTDSGGIQEEAPSLGKPVLVMRTVTERQEGVQAATVLLVGTDVESIVSACSQLLDDTEHYARMARCVNPYGDGYAAKRIAAILHDDLFLQINQVSQ